MLIGRAFAGKSTLAAALTRALVLGVPFLGRKTVQCRVGYFALERNGAVVARLFEQWGIADKVFFDYRMPTDPQKGAEYVHEQISELGLNVIIIDHLQHATHIQQGNDYTDVSEALAPYQYLASDTACAILGNHHKGKPHKDDPQIDEDQINPLGSEAYRAASDTLFECTKVAGNYFVRAETRTETDLPRTRILINRETGEAEAVDALQADMDAATGAIGDFLSRSGRPKKEREIIEAVTGRAATIGEALRAGVKEGKFRREGQGGKADPYRYVWVSHPSIGCAGNESKKSGESPTERTIFASPESRETNPESGIADPSQAEFSTLRLPTDGKHKSADISATYALIPDSSPTPQGIPPRETQETQPIDREDF